MNKSEQIIKSIEQADECEIMEFNFSECFQVLRAYDTQKQIISALEEQVKNLTANHKKLCMAYADKIDEMEAYIDDNA